MLSPEARQELDRRGRAAVEALLQNPNAVGVGSHSIVPLGLSAKNPSRSDVEEWLHEQELSAEQLAAERHEQQMHATLAGAHWSKYAFWAGVGSIGATVIGIIVSIILTK